MFAVGVLWGFRSEEELLSNGAKVVIEYPEHFSKCCKPCQKAGISSSHMLQYKTGNTYVFGKADRQNRKGRT
jgi:hypothetical protein